MYGDNDVTSDPDQSRPVILFAHKSSDRLDGAHHWTLLISQKDDLQTSFTVHCDSVLPEYVELGEGAEQQAADIYSEGLYLHALDNTTVHKVIEDPMTNYWSTIARLKDVHIIALGFTCLENHEIFKDNKPVTIILRYHPTSGSVVNIFQMDASPGAFRGDRKMSDVMRANYSVSFHSKLNVPGARRLQMLMTIDIDRDPFSSQKNLQCITLKANQKLLASLISGHRPDVVLESIPILT